MLPGFFHDTLGEHDRAHGRGAHPRVPAAPLRRSRSRCPTSRDADLARRHARGVATRSPRRCRRCRRAALYWARDARRPALRRHAVRRRARSATTPASIPAARSTTSTATRRAGVTPLGRSIDRTYLDSIGWRGIRQRKLHVEELLREAMARLAATQARRCASSTSPPATAATCSTRSAERGRRRPTRSCCATTATSTSRRAARSSPRSGLDDDRRFEQGRRLRPREPRARSTPRPTLGHRLRPLRAVPRQRAWCARSLAGARRRASPTAATSSTPASRGIRSSS